MEAKRIIAAVAERHGVLLDPGDPLVMNATILDLYAQDHRDCEAKREEQNRELLARINNMLTRAEAIAGGAIAQRAVSELPAAVRNLALRQLRWWCFWGGVLVILAMIAGGGIALWVRPAPEAHIAVDCHPLARPLSDGSTIECTFYTTLPTAAGVAR